MQSNLDAELDRLRKENTELKVQVARLSEQISFLGQHERLARGIRGETLLAGLINAQLTTHKAPHDLIAQNGLRFEVKSAKLNQVRAEVPTKRWVWGRLFGMTELKSYDYVMLVGEADDRYRAAYADRDDPYVFFVVPYVEVRQFCVGKKGNALIQLTTKPRPGMKNGLLFERYMMSMKSLTDRFSFSSD